MNKHSIIFKITLFFVLIFISINLLLYFYHFTVKENLISFQASRYMHAMKTIRDSLNEGEDIVNKRLENINLVLVKQNESNDILTKAKIVFVNEFITVYDLNAVRYLNLKIPPPPPPAPNFNLRPMFPKEKNMIKKPIDIEILLKDNSYEVYFFGKMKNYSYSFALLIDFLLISFYVFLYRKFKPLKKLKEEIESFSKGNLDISTKIKGKDEIADVSNDFDAAIKKIKELTDSRNLFLRNIMHEFKTPITKGKLIADTLDNCRKKEILQKAFYRLEYLLGEFAKIEELTSGKIKLKKNDFIVEELLDQSMDILLLDDSKLDIILVDKIINVDFELFSIALKNLIDNSIKYNTNSNPKIIVSTESITIKNEGEKLKKDIGDYLKPFNREYESIEEGLGLGLYITNSIVKIHGFKLHYMYKDNYHYFKIVF